MVRLTDHLDVTIVVDWDVKPQSNNNHTRVHPNTHLSITNEPSHEIMVLIVLRKLIFSISNMHAQPSNGARCLIFGQTCRLFPYFMCANSEGSAETALARRLA